MMEEKNFWVPDQIYAYCGVIYEEFSFMDNH